MAGMPVVSGAVQLASSMVLGVPAFRVTSGAAGAGGGSFTSVMLMVTAMVASVDESALPSESRPSLTPTVTP